MSSPLAITRVLGYSNAKAAVDNLTRWMATEMALKYGEGIRVNAIAPGFFIGNQNRALLTNEDGSYTSRGQQVIDNTPFRRFGNQEEVYGTIHYLISEAASFVTGTVVPVDGGFSTYSGV
jgi:NAD(P)-dependent dehydrogenase (short-subunit alcohol dehydrogenase family)